jgi:hypothetical protein
MSDEKEERNERMERQGAEKWFLEEFKIYDGLSNEIELGHLNFHIYLICNIRISNSFPVSSI